MDQIRSAVQQDDSKRDKNQNFAHGYGGKFGVQNVKDKVTVDSSSKLCRFFPDLLTP